MGDAPWRPQSNLWIHLPLEEPVLRWGSALWTGLAGRRMEKRRKQFKKKKVKWKEALWGPRLDRHALGCGSPLGIPAPRREIPPLI